MSPAPTPQPTTSDIMALFGSFSMKGVEPDTGQNVKDFTWPPDGDYTAQITDCLIESSEKTPYGGKASKIPGFTVQFVYKLLDDSTEAGPQRTIYGERFRFPTPAGLPMVTEPGQLQNIDITKKRLAGHIQVLLDRAPSDNTAHDVAKMVELVKDPNRQVICALKIASKPKGGYRNEVEYLVRCISK